MTTGGGKKPAPFLSSTMTMPPSIAPPPASRPRVAQLQALLADAVGPAFAGSEARIVAVFEVRYERRKRKKGGKEREKS